jgi:urea transport system ATP-binding protein
MLAVSSLNQYYSGSHTLRDVNFAVAPGSITGLMGRNGVGKTTLLNCILGLAPSVDGDIVFDGQRINVLSTENRASLGIALVPQGRMIFPRLTVEENLRVGLAARRDGKRDIPGLVYDLFPVLREMRQRAGGDLSGGQQQQLAIGRALAQGPRLLLLDEPCEGIQPSIVKDIAKSIRFLNQDLGITVVVVEQHLNFVRSVADFFYIMERGRLCADGPIDALDDRIVDAYLKV